MFRTIQKFAKDLNRVRGDDAALVNARDGGHRRHTMKTPPAVLSSLLPADALFMTDGGLETHAGLP